MSTTTQQWRMLPVYTLSVTTIVGVLDGIYTVMTGSTYYGGATRTPGSGSAWTFSRYQNAGTTEAVYGTPPTDTLNHRVIFGGATGAKTPTMASPDTWVVSSLLGSINKNSGSFNAWDAAAPFTSGSFYGYWKFFNAAGASAAAKLRIYESQECLAIFIEDAAGAIYGGFLGALIDPESTDTTSDAESDGKVYGIITSGHTAITGLNTGTASNVSTNKFMMHSTSNAQSHSGIFVPGSASIETMCRGENPADSTTTSRKTKSGRWVRQPQTMSRRSAAPNDTIIGRLREMNLVIDSTIGAVHQESSVDVYYYVGGSTSPSGDCLGLLY